jgi:hypothetical protein
MLYTLFEPTCSDRYKNRSDNNNFVRTKVVRMDFVRTHLRTLANLDRTTKFALAQSCSDNTLSIRMTLFESPYSNKHNFYSDELCSNHLIRTTTKLFEWTYSNHLVRTRTILFERFDFLIRTTLFGQEQFYSYTMKVYSNEILFEQTYSSQYKFHSP